MANVTVPGRQWTRWSTGRSMRAMGTLRPPTRTPRRASTMPTPLSLTDQEMAAVLDAAAPINPARRSAFLGRSRRRTGEVSRGDWPGQHPPDREGDPAPVHRRRWQARPRPALAAAWAVLLRREGYKVLRELKFQGPRKSQMMLVTSPQHHPAAERNPGCPESIITTRAVTIGDAV